MELIKFEAARKAIAEARTIDEVKTIRDKSEALRLYIKQQKGSLEMQNHCAEIKLRAERKAGELLKKQPKKVNRHSSTDTLSAQGITQKQSSRWQQEAEVPEEIFEEYIEEKKGSSEELTQAGLLRVAVDEKRKTVKTQKVELNTSKKYRIIYADPPWFYGNDYTKAMLGSTRPEDHYPSMRINELCEMPIKEISEDNAVLFMWVTSPLLEESFQVINAWKFKYKTSFVWDKIKHNYGHYNSVRHEFLLVCTKGSCTPDNKKLYDSVLSIEKTKIHSQKPEEFRDIIDVLYPTGKRIELFSRKKTKGWESYGNQLL